MLKKGKLTNLTSAIYVSVQDNVSAHKLQVAMAAVTKYSFKVLSHIHVYSSDLAQI